ncbi:hypothetical protein ACDF64_14965 [Agromyces sp. MMS24-JH15]|uniref:hypothetical protein n=1 Tax=Agromyces sp. MMS24-JH15 TaxID=3243765 RepID=UPI0037485718
MTAVPVTGRPQRKPAAQPVAPGRVLRPAPETGAGRRPRLAYAIVSTVGLLAIISAQLLLSLAMTEGAYEADRYETRRVELTRQQQKLREDIDRKESPQYLAMNAEALGMVPNNAPVYLRLSDAAVLGQPQAATGGAAASGPLVPNALLGGVPLVTQGDTGQTPNDGAVAAPGEAAPPPQVDALPTPDTH